jgi:hypoxanthine phosphoribosyltransferase
MNEIVTLSWEQIDCSVYTLANRLKANPSLTPVRIIAIARGGLIPAVMLSHYLGIRDVQMINAISYADDGKRNHGLLIDIGRSVMDTINSRLTLIMDDIYDTGHTMETIDDLAPLAQKVCIVSKKFKEEMITDVIFDRKVSKDVWVKFPWER